VGAERPDGGTLRLGGEELTFDSPLAATKRGIALMPQELAVVPTMSVVDNITLGSEPVSWGLRNGARCREEAAAALALLDLDVPLWADADALSGAHKRLIMMARALHKKAQLIVLDEPTAGLHPHEMELVGNAIRRLSSEHGVTVLLVSHHLSEVAALCEQVVCIGAGQVVATLGVGQVSSEALVAAMHGAAADPDAVTDDAPPLTSPVVAEDAATPEHAPEAGSRSIALEGVTGRRLVDVSLAARVGEVTGVTGLLGSGLADVVDLLIGAQQPVEGRVSLDGETMRLTGPDAAASAGIGYTSGERAKVAFTGLSIRRNVSISALQSWFGRLGLISGARERARVGQALEPFAVTARDHQDLSALSGGNQQRVLLARLFAADFDVLVLEEPTVGVDIVAREAIWSLVRRLKDDHVVVIVSSETDELEAMCDRVYCLRDGQVRAELSGAELNRRRITESII
jgi:ABC-type sugar transport system ATPase subunit